MGQAQFVLSMVSPLVAFPSNTFGLNAVDASHASLKALIVWRNFRGFTPSSFSASSSRVCFSFSRPPYEILAP